MDFFSEFPTVEDLRLQAKKRIPKFAFEYLDGGCNEDVNLHLNISDLKKIQLEPRYLKNYHGSSLKTTILGIEYDAPFGIAPVGLQGLMWPKSPQILAKAAIKHNIPFILSTVTTASIEEIGHITEGKAWFQLYHPAHDMVRDHILQRVEDAGYPVLVVLCDVPTFGYRPRDIKNGLALPPKMSMKNVIQILKKPQWAFETLRAGQPFFENLRPYMPANLNLKELGQFMNHTFSGRLNEERIKPIRDKWKGKLVLKGVASIEDAKEAIRLGFDGIIVSNHGGRQLDAGTSSIEALIPIAEKYSSQIDVMMDSGLRSGPDIAKAMACGAKFTFMGRPFMYGTAALGKRGGEHTVNMLKTQLKQVMEQLCCEKTIDLPAHLVHKNSSIN